MTARIIRYPRPRVLDELHADRHAVIEASAGTGKTHTLQNLVVELVVSEHYRIDEILVVTFTEKATREMRKRIRDQLMDMVDAFERDRSSNADDAWEIDGAGHTRLREALRAFDRAPISTVHGFCQRTLAEYAFEGGRPFGLEIIEPRATFGRVFREVARQALATPGLLSTALEAELARSSLEQVESALFEWYREAGRLRNRTDLMRFVEALRRMPEPEEVLALEPALKLAFPKKLKSVVKRISLLAEIAADFRANNDLASAVDAILEWRKNGQIENQVAADFLQANLLPASRLAAALAELAAIVVAIIDNAAPLLTAFVAELLPEIRSRLERSKAKNGHADFDDLLKFLADALLRSPMLVEELRQRYRCALIDEFQDTDEVQWSILRRVFFDGGVDNARGSNPRGRLIVIGDPKQAIYSFRNADVYTYRAATEAIRAQGGDWVSLAENYRSRPAVIRAYNTIFDSFFTGLNRYPVPVRSVGERPRLLDRNGKDVPAITLLAVPLGTANFKPALLDAIGTEIIAIREGRERICTPAGERAVLASEIHVLTRSRSEESEVAAALRARGIPVALFKQEGLFQTREAAHVAAVLAAIERPSDPSRRMRAWLSPFFGARLEQFRPGFSIDASESLVAVLYRWHELALRKDYARLMTAILEESGLTRRLLFRSSNERELTNYVHILEVLLAESSGREFHEVVSSLARLIAGTALARGENPNVQRLETAREAVQVLTMHGAKGLEAEVVFLYGGFGAAWPSGTAPQVFHDDESQRWIAMPPLDSKLKERVAEEARGEDERLLYVALTRARSRLVLPYFGGAKTKFAGPRARNGPYHLLHKRLEQIESGGDFSSECFEVRVSEPVLVPSRSADEASETSVVEAESATPDASAYVQIREARSGFAVTSYSRIKRAEELTTEVLTSAAFDAVTEEATEGELPGGSKTGSFLHFVLEHTDYAWFGAARNGDEELEALVVRGARMHGIDERYVPSASRIIRTALTTPIDLPRLRLPRGLAGVDRHRTELGFLYPIPERQHPPIERSEAATRSFPAERGFVRGVIDLVFEHEGQAYLLDWKSDRLARYDRGSLREHVGEHYQLQAQLYTLSVFRMLGITDRASYDRRFGGIIYCYLRGMSNADEGIHFELPAFAEVCAFENDARVDARFGAVTP